MAPTVTSYFWFARSFKNCLLLEFVHTVHVNILEMRSIEAVAIDIIYLISLMQQHGLEVTTLLLRTTSKNPSKNPLSSKNLFSGFTKWWPPKFFPQSQKVQKRQLKASTLLNELKQMTNQARAEFGEKESKRILAKSIFTSLQQRPHLLPFAVQLIESHLEEPKEVKPDDCVASFGPWLCFLQEHIALINHDVFWRR